MLIPRHIYAALKPRSFDTDAVRRMQNSPSPWDKTMRHQNPASPIHVNAIADVNFVFVPRHVKNLVEEVDSNRALRTRRSVCSATPVAFRIKLDVALSTRVCNRDTILSTGLLEAFSIGLQVTLRVIVGRTPRSSPRPCLYS